MSAIKPGGRLRLSGTFGAGQLVAAVAAFVIAGCILAANQFVSLRQALGDDVEIQAAIIADNISASLMFKDREAATEMLHSFRAATYLRSVSVYDRTGKLFAGYTKDGQVPARPPAAGTGGRLDALCVSRPVHYQNTDLGVVVLVASAVGVRNGMLRFAALFGMASLGALLVAMFVMKKTKTRVAEAERELDYLAYTDPVTALANRRATYETLEAAMRVHGREERRIALVMIDLDNFKAVNDTAGHSAGDQLLRQVADVLRAAARASDVVGRIGGDEFVVIAAPVRDRDEARAIATRITDALRRPFQLDNMELFATASVGISVFPDDAQSVTDLVSNADMALYEAKLSGKNRLAVFRPEMTLLTQRRVRIERELRKAMERGELEVFYQPQFDCASGRIVGAEALLRWTHAEHGPIAPGEFIPVAEESGLIAELGRWVLRRACSDAVAWRAQAGVALGIAVNVSARQLREEGFVLDVEKTLTETGLPANRLELELTESVLMENMDAALHFMHAIRALGVRLSIDDFGTGYSSLAYLQKFPISQLKIDRAFIQLLPDAGYTIASAVISLARGFNLSVVAEGVEEPAQLAWLRQAGCDYVQGYLLGRPMRVDALRALLNPEAAEALIS
jgi:diguanylate cyclase (GGDEF)-like protein